MKTCILRTGLILGGMLLALPGLRAQQYSIDWYKVSGGGGTSTNGQYAVSGTIGQHDAGAPMTGGTFSLTGGFWAIYAVQTPGSPYLFITQSGTNAILSWSAGAAGFLLESKSSLAAPGGWNSVSPLPATSDGTNYVTNGIAPGNNYYRLRHP